MDLWREQLTTIVRLATDLQTINVDDFTSGKYAPLAMDPQMFHGIIGSFTESTELLEAAKKAMVTGEYDYVNIKEEIADGQWYNAIMVDHMKANMGDLLSTVIKKLQLRYPDKYSDNSAINRDVVAERKVLEGK
jgi:NTP pyrophosphatase (non-canonical NTP hydrolase)